MIWISIALCILMSMVFSGLESAVLAVSQVRIRHRAKEREPGARQLLRLFRHRERLLASILLFNTLFNLLAFAAVTSQMVNRFAGWGYVAAFLIALPVYLFCIELLPKSLFKLYPYRMLLAFLPVLRAIRLAAAPVIGIAAAAALFRKREEQLPRPEMDAAGQRQEFRAIAATSEKVGKLGETEAAMILSVLDFQHCKVEKIMLPMANVTALPANMPITQAIQIARQTKFSHFPVMDENGRLIGLLNIYEALREGRLQGPVYSLIRRLVRVSTEDSGTAAIRTLRAAGLKIAAVHNPANKLVGIVTLRDLVNQLVKSPQKEGTAAS